MPYARTTVVVGILIAMMAPPCRAQVGAWQLQGTIHRRGFEHGNITSAPLLLISEDGTYRATGPLICADEFVGGYCELGTWKRLRKGRFQFTPVNVADFGSPFALCLFNNGFLSGGNVSVLKYRHTGAVKPDGGIVINSVYRVRARFAFYAFIHGGGTLTGTPADPSVVQDSLAECDL